VWERPGNGASLRVSREKNKKRMYEKDRDEEGRSSARVYEYIKPTREKWGVPREKMSKGGHVSLRDGEGKSAQNRP